MSSLNKIEKEIDVSQIKHEDDCIWPIVKSYLITLYPSKSDMLKKTSLGVIGLLLKSLILDVFSVFKIYKSNIWVFTNSERRYAINNIYFDRVTSGLLSYFDKYVLFENPIPKGRSRKKSLQKGELLVGMSWIYLIQYFIIRITKKPKIEGLEVLGNYMGMNLNKIESIYHRYHVSYLFYTFLFKVRKPKAVFVVCYYSNFGLVKACKKSKVPVLELQHGIVTEQHRAYNFSKNYGNVFFPDFFLGYGSHFNDVVSKGNVVNKSQTLDYGYSFLYEANKCLKVSSKMSFYLNEYDKVICITGQLEDTDNKLLDLINESVDKFPSYLFIYKPRKKSNKVLFKAKNNFIKWEDVNTYLLLKYCDYHLTIYSTCALESIALGTPTISIDIDGLYSQHLKSLVGDNEYNHVVDSDSTKLNDLLRSLQEKKSSPNEISNSIGNIISPMISKEFFFEFFNNIVKKKSCH